MLKKWKLIPNNCPGFGLNRISMELQPTNDELKMYAGYRRWVNAADINDLKYFLKEKFITNLEYLEGVVIIKELDEESKS